jgi:diguanylate cyclase (GGDEF)-like protein
MCWRAFAITVTEAQYEMISIAAQSADNLMEAQLHAISLVRSVYPLPDRPPLEAIPLRELTVAEKKMTYGERLTAARVLVLNIDYSYNKQSVSQNVNACVESMKEDAERELSETTEQFRSLGVRLIAAMLLGTALLIGNFAVQFRLLLRPLQTGVRLIETDEALDENKGLREVRLLAAAYNRLLKRRDSLEGILRSAAQTDRLTGLPNRYGYEQYLIEAGSRGFSLGVFLFDINYLKRTNDTLGHAAGDQLIRSAAQCICDSFGVEGEGNCFRFGGDEFAAVVKNCDPEQLRQMEERFEELQRERRVSISWGRAYTGELGGTSVKALMDEADKKLYECKERMHAEAEETGA